MPQKSGAEAPMFVNKEMLPPLLFHDHRSTVRQLYPAAGAIMPVIYCRRRNGIIQDDSWIVWMIESSDSLALVVSEGDTCGVPQLTHIGDVVNHEHAREVAKALALRQRTEGYRFVRHADYCGSVIFARPQWEVVKKTLAHYGLCAEASVLSSRVNIMAPGSSPLDHNLGTVFLADRIGISRDMTVCYEILSAWDEDDPDKKELLDLRGLAAMCNIVPNRDDVGHRVRQDADAVKAMAYFQENLARFSPEVVAAAKDLGLLAVQVDYTRYNGIPSLV
jgi:hypothetical protein